MIVVMSADSTPKDVETVEKHIVDAGMRPHHIVGAERTIIGVIGAIYPELQNELEALPGVMEAVRVSRPYKLTGREFHPIDSVVTVGGVRIGGDEPLVVMAGPCAVESEEQLMTTARLVKESGAKILRGGAFKPRTSPYSFRGLGEDGLKILAAARDETGLPVITEVMDTRDVDVVARHADILQIGARNVQNYALLEEAAQAGKPVLLKRGFATTYEDLLLAGEYILATGNADLLLCERGIRTFEAGTRNTMDLTAIPVLRRLSHLPIVADPSHGTGAWYLVTPMAMAAAIAGVHSLLIEVHPTPDTAKSDGPQSLTPKNFAKLMAQLDQLSAIFERPPAMASAS